MTRSVMGKPQNSDYNNQRINGYCMLMGKAPTFSMLVLNLIHRFKVISFFTLLCVQRPIDSQVHMEVKYQNREHSTKGEKWWGWIPPDFRTFIKL